MLLVEVFAKIGEQSLDEWSLSAARHHSYCHVGIGYSLHQRDNPVEYLGFGHRVEYASLHVVHLLCFLVCYLSALLSSHHHAYGVHALGSLGGVCVCGSHVDAKSLHRLLPCYCMIGHGVIEYAIHIEKHGFRQELSKAMLCEI